MTGLMTKKNKVEIIESYLDVIFPNPVCELNYTKDYELLIAVMLSAQTTDKRVNMVTKILFSKYPNLELLKDANIDDIIDIIRPIGTFNRKAVYLLEIANILYNDYDGVVPCDRKILESMPGVGRKVANVMLSEWFKVPNIAVDTHVERVSKRLGLVSKNDDVAKIEKKLEKKIPKDRWIKTHHQFIFFGRYHCKAIKPNCSNCKLQCLCKYYQDKNK